MKSAPTISVVIPIYAPTPFLRDLAEFAIKTLRSHADGEFELIIVEVVHNHFDKDAHDLVDPRLFSDKYLRFEQKIGVVKEVNQGLAAATGDFILLTGTDVVAPSGWDTELLRVFADRPKDCGVASLSAFEPGAIIGPHSDTDLVVEGMFSPFMMFRKEWRFDEVYQRVYPDSDMVMRMYESGLRAFRSCRKHVWHLGSVTNKNAGPEHAALEAKALARDERLFYQRWGKSPLMMFGMIRGGMQVYGREHEAFLNPIKLHHDPSAPE